MFVSLEARAWDIKGDAVLDVLVTTAAGALSATVGVLVGGIVTRRAQDRHWIRDQQLAAYQELFSHYAKFTMELRRAHADRRGWDYDWGRAPASAWIVRFNHVMR